MMLDGFLATVGSIYNNILLPFYIGDFIEDTIFKRAGYMAMQRKRESKPKERNKHGRRKPVMVNKCD